MTHVERVSLQGGWWEFPVPYPLPPTPNSQPNHFCLKSILFYVPMFFIIYCWTFLYETNFTEYKHFLWNQLLKQSQSIQLQHPITFYICYTAMDLTSQTFPYKVFIGTIFCELLSKTKWCQTPQTLQQIYLHQSLFYI